MNAQSNLRFIATCVPGAEPWLARELSRLQVTTEVVEGGVEGRGSLPTIRYLVQNARLAESIRVRATRPFVARNFDELNEGLRRVPWHAYLVPGLPLDVRVTCKRSRLFHSGAVAERVRKVIEVGIKCLLPDASGLSVNTHCNRVYVRLLRDHVQVSFDAAGEALHRRGYRRHVGQAPLRETLAALLLRIAQDAVQQHPFLRLWDPCAGSGTIPLEWLLERTSLQTRSAFLMDEWPCFAKLTAPVGVDSTPSLGVATRSFADDTSTPIVTISDVAPTALEAARANARAFGVEGLCTFRAGDLSDVEPTVPDGTAVVTNLPYGVRLGSQRQAVALLRRLDAVLERRKGLRPAVVLWGAGALPSSIVAAYDQPIRFRNGGRAVTVLVKR